MNLPSSRAFLACAGTVGNAQSYNHTWDREQHLSQVVHEGADEPWSGNEQHDDGGHQFGDERQRVFIDLRYRLEDANDQTYQ